MSRHQERWKGDIDFKGAHTLYRRVKFQNHPIDIAETEMDEFLKLYHEMLNDLG